MRSAAKKLNPSARLFVAFIKPQFAHEAKLQNFFAVIHGSQLLHVVYMSVFLPIRDEKRSETKRTTHWSVAGEFLFIPRWECYKTIDSCVSCAFIEIWSTWEVWRALKKLELLSATPRATLTHLSCSPNFPRASYIDERTLTHESIVNYLPKWDTRTLRNRHFLLLFRCNVNVFRYRTYRSLMVAVYNSSVGWDWTSACKGATGSRYSPCFDLTHPHTHTPTHHRDRPPLLGVRPPLFSISVWVLKHPTDY